MIVPPPPFRLAAAQLNRKPIGAVPAHISLWQEFGASGLQLVYVVDLSVATVSPRPMPRLIERSPEWFAERFIPTRRQLRRRSRKNRYR